MFSSSMRGFRTPPPLNVSSSNAIASLSQRSVNLVALESAMINLVNKERRTRGLPRLAPDAMLASVSRAHSLEMRDRNCFSHQSPTRTLRQPIDRYHTATAAPLTALAENIFHSSGSTPIDENAMRRGHESLMNSPGHRANILRREMTHIGIGFAARDNCALWITQMFLC